MPQWIRRLLLIGPQCTAGFTRRAKYAERSTSFESDDGSQDGPTTPERNAHLWVRAPNPVRQVRLSEAGLDH
jgi:hypothetical protein